MPKISKNRQNCQTPRLRRREESKREKGEKKTKKTNDDDPESRRDYQYRPHR